MNFDVRLRIPGARFPCGRGCGWSRGQWCRWRRTVPPATRNFSPERWPSAECSRCREETAHGWSAVGNCRSARKLASLDMRAHFRERRMTRSIGRPESDSSPPIRVVKSCAPGYRRACVCGAGHCPHPAAARAGASATVNDDLAVGAFDAGAQRGHAGERGLAIRTRRVIVDSGGAFGDAPNIP